MKLGRWELVAGWSVGERGKSQPAMLGAGSGSKGSFLVEEEDGVLFVFDFVVCFSLKAGLILSDILNEVPFTFETSCCHCLHVGPSLCSEISWSLFSSNCCTHPH